MTLALGFIGIVTQDMSTSLAFYRALGVTIAEGQDDAPHVDAVLDDGTALAWDTVATIRGFDPEYRLPAGGHRIALAFRRPSADDVDEIIRSLATADTPRTWRRGTPTGVSAMPPCSTPTATRSISSRSCRGPEPGRRRRPGGAHG